MSQEQSQAPGAPGGPEVWNPGSKVGVGTAFGDVPLWFTLGRGAIEEVFFPRTDCPRSRDLGLAVADGKTFFSWEKDDTESEAASLESGVPAYRLVNRCRSDRYRIEKEIFAHPERPAIVQRTRFVPAPGHDLALYALLNPHLGEQADAWVGDYKGAPMLFAAGDGVALALACSAPWLKRSVGFAGKSDGWYDLTKHRRMTWAYDRADGGNAVLTGEIDHAAGGGDFLLVLAFGIDAETAGMNAHAALLDGFDAPLARYSSPWKAWQGSLLPLAGKAGRTEAVYRASAAVLKTHEAKVPPGAAVASLTVPFGQARSGDDTGGYHLVWPRDLIEATGGMLATGSLDRARATLAFLETTQEPDGNWSQNMWLSGKPYWNGIQMDETAMTVLLFDLARREGALEEGDNAHFWPMIRKAAGYLVRNGPATPEDRWEHDGGYSPFTLGAEIAGLLTSADLATENGEPALAVYLRETADVWNAGIERWTYVIGTKLARRVGVEGYYVRLGSVKDRGGPPDTGSDPRDGSDASSVSPDALALVRFGLRAADDTRIVNTVKVLDAVLTVDLGYGPGWRRYTSDKYGEHADGSAFTKGSGIGRAWPLFAGERGHYELAAGRPREAERMARLMEAAATVTGLIPEQVWDADDLPDKALFRGRPTTSACPLVWAHAEYVKLLRSIRDGAVFDMPRQTIRRYGKGFTRPHTQVWRFNDKRRELSSGNALRVEVLEPAVVRWSADGWETTQELATADTGLGLHVADLATERVRPGDEVVFTFHWTAADRWEGADFRVAVTKPEDTPSGH